MEEYNLIDNGAGVLAAVAGYKITMNKLGNHPGIIGLGCQLIAAYVGLEIGNQVRGKVKRVRKNVEEVKENRSEEKGRFHWTQILPEECKKCSMNERFPGKEPCAHCDVCLNWNKEVQNG